jgi:FkbM family methyltransferase
MGTSTSFKELKRACVSCTHWLDAPAVLAGDAHCNLGVTRDAIQDPETFVCSRHEIRPPELKQVKGIEFYMRQWFDDSAMTSEAMRTARRIGARPDDVVLDLGAHIGSFGWTLLSEFNVKQCIFVEADPINIDVLRVNTAQFGDRAIIEPYAVVGRNPATKLVTLWRTGYTGCGSLHRRKRFFNVKVPTVELGELLDRYRPTFLKIDVEGAEFDFTWEMNSEVREIYAEIHRHDVERRDVVPVRFADEPLAIVQKLESQGFRVTHRKQRLGFHELSLVRGD